MLNLHDLKRQHQWILQGATRLVGLSEGVKTREDAFEARAVIDGIHQMLVDHLSIEDDHLYPALLKAADPATVALAADCFEEMGGIKGAWIAFRDHWTAAAIVGDTRRFSAATAGIIGALALRVERENTELYPAMEALSATWVERPFTPH